MCICAYGGGAEGEPLAPKVGLDLKIHEIMT